MRGWRSSDGVSRGLVVLMLLVVCCVPLEPWTQGIGKAAAGTATQSPPVATRVVSTTGSPAVGAVAAVTPTDTQLPSTVSPTPTATATMLPTSTQTPASVPFARGDVFLSVPGGLVNHYDATGRLLAVLNTGSASATETGMCLDASNQLYSTNPTSSDVSQFSPMGVLLTYPWPSSVTPWGNPIGGLTIMDLLT